MKRKSIIIISIILVLVISIFICFNLYKHNQKAQERYSEIKESVKNAVERNIRAQYPGCLISKEFKETTYPGTSYNSNFLIKNGYIKKEELLDIDKKSYCDVYVDINTFFVNPLDHQKDCEVYYKIYLKCKNYEDKGYINWD
ncbi:MAG: hypothetical protein E7161_01190 [Firmicutes bacterium]|nr:hypothetical protein [Bacillota bacterium]